MAKKSILTILPIAIGALLVSGLTACGGTGTQSGDDGSSQSSEIVANTFKVNFKDGQTVLHTVEVEKNEKVTQWDPASKVTNKEFFGWFAEPTLRHAFDFTQGITKDTDIFGSFVSYKKDERKWAISGSGASSILKSSNNANFLEEHYMKNESTATANIFTMTVNLFKDDAFQFTSPVKNGDKYSWGHQRGAGYLKDDSKNFIVGNSLAGDNYAANITCAKDGKYEFTLKTYPAGDFQKDDDTHAYMNRNYYDTLTVKRLGECEEERAEVETTYYMKGELITGWNGLLNPHTILAENPKNKNELKLEHVYLLAKDQFMFATKNTDVKTGEVSDANIYVNSSNLTDSAKKLAKGTNPAKASNIKVNEDGYYSFKYLVEEKTLDIEKVEYTPVAGAYYLDGTFGGRGWGIDETNNLFVSSTDPKAKFGDFAEKEITVAKGEEIVIQYYDKNAPQDSRYNGCFASQYLVLDEATNKAFDTTGFNIKAVTAGTYKVSFNSYSHLITIAAK